MTTLWHDLLNLLGSSLSAFYNLVPNYGVAIILLTIAVRLVLLPLTIKQTRSMQEMQKLQPELKRLQAKYKGGDKAKLNEEMMKMYKEHQVNPLGGCLPLVLQLPIFWALYRVLDGCGKTIAHSKTCAAGFVGVKYLPSGSALRAVIRAVTPGHLGHAGFLGMNLGVSPVAFVKSDGLVHAIPYIVLVFLMVATTWYQQKQIMAVSSGQPAQQMQMMGKIMPVVLGVFSLELAAGVSIYWVASNAWTIVQQYFVLGKPSLATAEAGGGAGDARPGKGGGGPGGSGKGKPAPDKSDAKGDAKGTSKPAPARAGAKAPAGNGRAAGSQQNGSSKPKRPAAAGENGGKPVASNGKAPEKGAEPKPVGGKAPAGKAPANPANKEDARSKPPADTRQPVAAKPASETDPSGADPAPAEVSPPAVGTPAAAPAGSSRPRPQRAEPSARKRNRR